MLRSDKNYWRERCGNCVYFVTKGVVPGMKCWWGRCELLHQDRYEDNYPCRDKLEETGENDMHEDGDKTPIGCDTVGELVAVLDGLDRYKKLEVLLTIMDILDLCFADGAASRNALVEFPELKLWDSF